MKCKPDEDPFELSLPQIKQLIKLTHFRKSDIFCDLGCGSGRVVVEVRKRKQVKLSKGIDIEECQFCKTWPLACKQLRKGDFEHIDFKLANMDTYDYSDATVLYYSMHEAGTTVKDLQKRLENKRLRIITKDLPFVGYIPNDANRDNKGCWLFLTNYPFIQTRDLDEWIKAVLGRPGSIQHLLGYYRSKMGMHYPKDVKYHAEVVRDLKKLIKKRFGIRSLKGKKGRSGISRLGRN